MPYFDFKGRDIKGALISGQLQANSPDAVANHLTTQQIIPIDIKPASVTSGFVKVLRERFKKKNITLLDLIFFSRQMHTLLKAGAPILSALVDLRDSTTRKDMQDAIDELYLALDAGQEMSGALRLQPDVFPPLFGSMVEVGETSGNMDESFNMLAVYLEKERELRNRISSAIRYPIIVISALFFAMVIINIWVIPAFAGFFESNDAELPVITLLLIGLSNFSLQYWPLLLVSLIAFIVGFRLYIKTPAGRHRFDTVILKVPLIGEIIFRSILGRVANTLSMCIRAGITWTQALMIVSKTAQNKIVAGKIIKIRDGIDRGETITAAAKACGLFPPLVLQMLKVGEQTGEIDRLLDNVADYYEREVEYQLKMLNEYLEPLLIVIVGIMVLILALGVFLPMWDMSQAAMS